MMKKQTNYKTADQTLTANVSTVPAAFVEQMV